MDKPTAFDTAYPGSMSERHDGYFLRRDDHKSLAAALVELIASRDREIEDLRDAVEMHKRDSAELVAALKGVLYSLKWHTERSGNVGLDAHHQLEASALISKLAA